MKDLYLEPVDTGHWTCLLLELIQVWSTLISCASFAACVRKFDNLRDRGHLYDVNDLRRRLIDVWVGVEQSVIDDGIDQWRRRLYECIEPLEDISDINCDKN